MNSCALSNTFDYIKYIRKKHFCFVGHQLIFISGPVVVSPSSTITFHVYLSNQNILNVEWWKIKGQSQKQLVPDNEKYKSIYEGNNIYKFEITTAKPEDSGTYHCIANNMKSNTLYVYVNGKYIHIFYV